MTVKIRTVIEKVEKLRSGHVQFRVVTETYEDTVLPQEAVEAVFEDIIISEEIEEVLATITEGVHKGKKAVVIPYQAAVIEKRVITPAKEEITGIESVSSSYRFVIQPGETIPQEVLDFWEL